MGVVIDFPRIPFSDLLCWIKTHAIEIASTIIFLRWLIRIFFHEL
jgi:hypothetical protein